MIELIVSDMDGTLLNENMEISQETVDAIMDTYNQGIPFLVCTGRNFTEAKIPLDEAGIRCPILGLNGAIHFDRTGTVDYEVGLSNDTAKAIIEVGYKAGYYVEAMTSKNVYSSSKENRIRAITELISRVNPDISIEEARVRATQSHEVNTIEYRDELRDLIDEEHQQILKIVFIHEDGQKELASTADKLYEDFQGIYVTSSFSYNIEISHKRATKGEAIIDYCREHGYNIENVVTIGDNFNDVPMLEAAGYSFAMDNAEPGVKKVAKYATESNDNNGVAKAIKQALEMAAQEKR